MTLLETAVYLAVFSIVCFPIFLMMSNSTRSTRETDVLSRVLERNRSAIRRVCQDFRGSISGSHSVGPLGKILTFTVSSGFNGVGSNVGDVISYSIQDDPDDAFNGVDDDGNGITDEVILVRVNQTTGDQAIVATNLDYFGSGFSTSGGGVTITISTVGRTAATHAPTSTSQTIQVFPRNISS